MKNNNKIKILASLTTLCVTIICTIIALTTSIETTSIKIIGSFASIFAISIVAWRFPTRFYIFAMIFDILATSFGSVINLYKSVNSYDRVVHYISGILLFEGGLIIIDYLFKKRGLKSDDLIRLLFAFLFSSACAGFWEIYEFTADIIINANMQGDKINTMGDIVAGVLGASTYLVIMLFLSKKKTNNSKAIR